MYCWHGLVIGCFSAGKAYLNVWDNYLQIAPKFLDIIMNKFPFFFHLLHAIEKIYVVFSIQKAVAVYSAEDFPWVQELSFLSSLELPPTFAFGSFF